MSTIDKIKLAQAALHSGNSGMSTTNFNTAAWALSAIEVYNLKAKGPRQVALGLALAESISDDLIKYNKVSDQTLYDIGSAFGADLAKHQGVSSLITILNSGYNLGNTLFNNGNKSFNASDANLHFKYCGEMKMSAEAYEKTYNYLRDGTRIRADDINGNDESLLVNSISLTNEILGSADYKYSNQANIVSTSVTAIYNVNQFFKEYNEKDANGYSKGFVR